MDLYWPLSLVWWKYTLNFGFQSFSFIHPLNPLQSPKMSKIKLLNGGHVRNIKKEKARTPTPENFSHSKSSPENFSFFRNFSSPSLIFSRKRKSSGLEASANFSRAFILSNSII